MSEDGRNSLFEEPNWNTNMSFQMKLTTLVLTRAKAILIVSDPKSGFQSVSESSPELAGYIESKISLKGGKEEIVNPFMATLPKVIFVHRSVADELLKDSGHSLENLQKNIDATLKPNSFTIANKQLKITEVTISEEKILNNIAGYIEGRDPVLKNEVVVFSGHYDHLGTSGDKVNTGADDNASGCAALLSMAEAFQSLARKPLRSIMFLWVSGEEIGLYGSKSYVNNPLFPIEKTVADLNMDMIGRVKGIADSTDSTPMTDSNSVFVITDSQSKELRSIADDIDKRSKIDFDYSLITTGLHSDYHTPGDVVEKIDFKKMEMVTRTMYQIGLTIANKKSGLIVDNPFSSW